MGHNCLMQELQLQGLVGPTHNYAGLGRGNVASKANAGNIANPRAAALQSLELMRWLLAQEVPVAVLPPQARPRLDVLEKLGFTGSVAEKLQAASAASPQLLRAIWSSSFMWAANAATVTASADATDGQLHLTPANLISSLHRMLEARETEHFLSRIFPFATVHPPLNVTSRLTDEGAANHMRLSDDGAEALQLFVYGSSPPDSPYPAHFMPRQTLAASEEVAQQHTLASKRCLFVQQHPAAIDAGVFHHDVIGLSHHSLLVMHERALFQQSEAIFALQRRAPWLHVRIVSEAELPLSEAVSSYFFNAQLVSLANGQTAILFPQECAENQHTQRLADELSALPMVGHIGFWNLRESMKNGGGPACLRLRVPLTEDELAHVHGGARLDTRLLLQLERFIAARYRDRVTPADLLDAAFAEEAQQVQQDVLTLLGLNA